MLFQIIQPFVADIYGDSFKEAIKQYIKFNYNSDITNMIIKDQQNHYQTRLKYYKENNKKKVSIDISPYVNIPYSPIIAGGPIIKSNTPITFNPAFISGNQPFISGNQPFISGNQPFISTNPLVTVKGSPFMASNNGIFYK